MHRFPFAVARRSPLCARLEAYKISLHKQPVLFLRYYVYIASQYTSLVCYSWAILHNLQQLWRQVFCSTLSSDLPWSSQFPHHGNLHESKSETWFHQAEPERYTSRVEAPGLCCICEVRHGTCQFYMGSSFHQG